MDTNFTQAGAQLAGHQLDQSAFAGPVGADESSDAWLDGEADVVDRSLPM